MKHLLLFASIIITTLAPLQAATSAIDEEKFKYDGTVHVEGATTQDILRRAKKWYATGLDSEHRILDKYEVEPNKVVIKGTGGVKFTGKENAFKKGYVKYDFVIIIMDGMYSYIIKGFDHEYESYSGGLVEEEKPDCGFFMITKKQWENLKMQVTAHGTALEADLTAMMEQAVPKAEDSDYGIFVETASTSSQVASTPSGNATKGDASGKYQIFVQCANCDITYGVGAEILEEKNVKGTWTFGFNPPANIPFCSVMAQHITPDNIRKIVVEIRQKEGDSFTTLISDMSESSDKIAKVQYTFQ